MSEVPSPAASSTALLGQVADFLDERGEGTQDVCFATDDIGATAAHPGAGAAPAIGGRDLPCAFLVAQPHGARVELTEREVRGRPGGTP